MDAPMLSTPGGHDGRPRHSKWWIVVLATVGAVLALVAQPVRGAGAITIVGTSTLRSYNAQCNDVVVSGAISVTGGLTIANPNSITMHSSSSYFIGVALTIVHDLSACRTSPLSISTPPGSSYFLVSSSTMQLLNSERSSISLGSASSPLRLVSSELTIRGSSRITLFGDLTSSSVVITSSSSSNAEASRFVLALSSSTITVTNSGRHTAQLSRCISCSATLLGLALSGVPLTISSVTNGGFTASSPGIFLEHLVASPILRLPNLQYESCCRTVTTCVTVGTCHSVCVACYDVLGIAGANYVAQFSSLTQITITTTGVARIEILPQAVLLSSLIVARSVAGSTLSESLLIRGPLTASYVVFDLSAMRSATRVTVSSVTFASATNFLMEAVPSSPCPTSNLTLTGGRISGGAIVVSGNPVWLSVAAGVTLQTSQFAVSFAAASSCASQLIVASGATITNAVLSFQSYVLGSVSILGTLRTSRISVYGAVEPAADIKASIVVQPLASTSSTITGNSIAPWGTVDASVTVGSGQQLVVTLMGSACGGASMVALPVVEVMSSGTLSLSGTFGASTAVRSARIGPSAALWLSTTCLPHHLIVSDANFTNAATLHLNGWATVSVHGVRLTGGANTISVVSVSQTHVAMGSMVSDPGAPGGAQLTVTGSCLTATVSGVVLRDALTFRGVQTLFLNGTRITSGGALSATTCASTFDIRTTPDVVISNGSLAVQQSGSSLGGTIVLSWQEAIQATIVVQTSSASVRTTIAAPSLTERSMCQLLLNAGSATIAAGLAVLSGSSLTVSSSSSANDLSGVAIVANATLVITNDDGDNDVAALLSLSQLNVRKAVVTLMGGGTPTNCTANMAACTVHIRGSTWAGSTLCVVAPSRFLDVATATDLTLVGPSRAQGLLLSGVLTNSTLDLRTAGQDEFSAATNLELVGTALSWTMECADAARALLMSPGFVAHKGAAVSLVATTCRACLPIAIDGSAFRNASLTLAVPFAVDTSVDSAGVGATIAVTSGERVTVRGAFRLGSRTTAVAKAYAVVALATLTLNNASFRVEAPSVDVGSMSFAPSAVNRSELTIASHTTTGARFLDGRSVRLSAVTLAVPLHDATLTNIANAGCGFTITARSVTSSGAWASGVHVTIVIPSGNAPSLLNLDTIPELRNTSVALQLPAIALMPPWLTRSMWFANLSVALPLCGGACASVEVDNSLMYRSSIALSILGRALSVVNVNIPGALNVIRGASKTATVSGVTMRDVAVDLSVSDGIEIEPKLVASASLSITTSVNAANDLAQVLQDVSFRDAMGALAVSAPQLCRTAACRPLVLRSTHVVRSAIEITALGSEVVVTGLRDRSALTVVCDTLRINGSFTNRSHVVAAGHRALQLAPSKISASSLNVSLANASASFFQVLTTRIADSVLALTIANCSDCGIVLALHVGVTNSRVSLDVGNQTLGVADARFTNASLHATCGAITQTDVAFAASSVTIDVGVGALRMRNVQLLQGSEQHVYSTGPRIDATNVTLEHRSVLRVGLEGTNHWLNVSALMVSNRSSLVVTDHSGHGTFCGRVATSSMTDGTVRLGRKGSVAGALADADGAAAFNSSSECTLWVGLTAAHRSMVHLQPGRPAHVVVEGLGANNTVALDGLSALTLAGNFSASTLSVTNLTTSLDVHPNAVLHGVHALVAAYAGHQLNVSLAGMLVGGLLHVVEGHPPDSERLPTSSIATTPRVVVTMALLNGHLVLEGVRRWWAPGADAAALRAVSTLLDATRSQHSRAAVVSLVVSAVVLAPLATTGNSTITLTNVLVRLEPWAAGASLPLALLPLSDLGMAVVNATTLDGARGASYTFVGLLNAPGVDSSIAIFDNTTVEVVDRPTSTSTTQGGVLSPLQPRLIGLLVANASTLQFRNLSISLLSHGPLALVGIEHITTSNNAVALRAVSLHAVAAGSPGASISGAVFRPRLAIVAVNESTVSPNQSWRLVYGVQQMSNLSTGGIVAIDVYDVDVAVEAAVAGAAMAHVAGVRISDFVNSPLRLTVANLSTSIGPSCQVLQAGKQGSMAAISIVGCNGSVVDAVLQNLTAWNVTTALMIDGASPRSIAMQNIDVVQCDDNGTGTPVTIAAAGAVLDVRSSTASVNGSNAIEAMGDVLALRHLVVRCGASWRPAAAVSIGPAGVALSIDVAVSRFDGCSLLAHTDSAVSRGLRDIVWACNLWDGGNQLKSFVRTLVQSPLYALPTIDDRFGKAICRSDTVSAVPTASHSAWTPSDQYTSSRSAAASVTTSLSISSSATVTASKTASSTTSATLTGSPSATTSASTSHTYTTSDTGSVTDSLTVSIDPCNTTFRSDSDDFVRQVTLLTDIGRDVAFNASEAMFMVLNRVQLATLGTIRLQLGFNTYLRNFYYNTSLAWFAVPQTVNCISGGFELVNATDIVVRIDYDPDVSLRTGVHDDYHCNLTFSSDIFQCQLMTNFSFNFSTSILVTGTPTVVSAAQAAAVDITAAMVALLSSGAALLQQSRAESLASLSQCQFSLVDELSIQECPLQLGFGSPLQYFHRGCVVGNLAVVFGFALVVLLVALVAAGMCRRDVVVLQWQAGAPLPPSTATPDEHSHDDDGERTVELQPVSVANSSDAQATPLAEKDTCDATVALLAGYEASTVGTAPILALSTWTFDAPLHRSDQPVQTAQTLLSGVEINVDGERDVEGVTNDSCVSLLYHTAVLDLPTDDAHDGAPPLPSPPVKEADVPVDGPTEEVDVDVPGPQLVATGTRVETFAQALRRVCGIVAFPSIVLLPLSLLADSTVCSSVRLLVHPIDTYDTAIGGVAVAMYGALLLACVMYAVRSLPTVASPPRIRKTNVLASRGRVQSLLRYWCLPTADLRPPKRRARHAFGMMRHMLDDSKYPAFFCCDVALSILLAALVGVGISRREVCASLAAAGVGGYALFCVAVVVMRPGISRLSLLINVTGSGLGLVSSVLTVVLMHTGMLLLGTVNQWISLCTLLLGMLQFVSTAIGILSWMRSIAAVMLVRHGATSIGATLASIVGAEALRPLRVVLERNGHEIDSVATQSDDDDADLWSDDGTTESGRGATEPDVALDVHVESTGSAGDVELLSLGSGSGGDGTLSDDLFELPELPMSTSFLEEPVPDGNDLLQAFASTQCTNLSTLFEQAGISSSVSAVREHEASVVEGQDSGEDTRSSSLGNDEMDDVFWFAELPMNALHEG